MPVQLPYLLRRTSGSAAVAAICAIPWYVSRACHIRSVPPSGVPAQRSCRGSPGPCTSAHTHDARAFLSHGNANWTGRFVMQLLPRPIGRRAPFDAIGEGLQPALRHGRTPRGALIRRWGAPILGVRNRARGSWHLLTVFCVLNAHSTARSDNHSATIVGGMASCDPLRSFLKPQPQGQFQTLSASEAVRRRGPRGRAAAHPKRTSSRGLYEAQEGTTGLSERLWGI